MCFDAVCDAFTTRWSCGHCRTSFAPTCEKCRNERSHVFRTGDLPSFPRMPSVEIQTLTSDDAGHVYMIRFWVRARKDGSRSIVDSFSDASSRRWLDTGNESKMMFGKHKLFIFDMYEDDADTRESEVSWQIEPPCNLIVTRKRNNDPLSTLPLSLRTILDRFFCPFLRKNIQLKWRNLASVVLSEVLQSSRRRSDLFKKHQWLAFVHGDAPFHCLCCALCQRWRHWIQCACPENMRACSSDDSAEERWMHHY